MRLVTIVGARPQFVKAAALSRAIIQSQNAGEAIQETIVHTGQHYDPNMSEIFFQEMDIPFPRHHLGIGGCTQGAMTGRMLEALETILLKERPDWVIIYGDTNSTLAGALAATKLHIPVAHIEAGLRSFNRKMPEEINRIVADHCADLLFTPSQIATDQLLKENIDKKKISQVGDIMYDVAKHYQTHTNVNHIFETLHLKKKNYVLATIHRQENTTSKKRMTEIIHGLILIGNHTPVIFPLHPRTKQVVEDLDLIKDIQNSNLIIIDPVGYLDMIQLEINAKAIVTDSGGVQKEAYFFQVPCLTLREETEWSELVQHGFNKLVPADRLKIQSNYLETITTSIAWIPNLYGNGQTAQMILQELTNRAKS